MSLTSLVRARRTYVATPPPHLPPSQLVSSPFLTSALLSKVLVPSQFADPPQVIQSAIRLLKSQHERIHSQQQPYAHARAHHRNHSGDYFGMTAIGYDRPHAPQMRLMSGYPSHAHHSGSGSSGTLQPLSPTSPPPRGFVSSLSPGPGHMSNRSQGFHSHPRSSQELQSYSNSVRHSFSFSSPRNLNPNNSCVGNSPYNDSSYVHPSHWRIPNTFAYSLTHRFIGYSHA